MKKIKAYMSKGEISTAVKNGGKPSKRDVADDYGCVWFTKDSIPDKRGMVEVEIKIINQPNVHH